VGSRMVESRGVYTHIGRRRIISRVVRSEAVGCLSILQLKSKLYYIGSSRSNSHINLGEAYRSGHIRESSATSAARLVGFQP
jgi:hypothetical protein